MIHGHNETGKGVRVAPTRSSRIEIKGLEIKQHTSYGMQIEDGDQIDVHHCGFAGNSTDLVIQPAASRVSGHDCGLSSYTVDAAATDIFIDDPTFNGEQGANPGSSTYTLSFDSAFTHYPRIDLTVDAAVDSYSNWTTDGNGNYTRVDLTFGTTPSNLSWEAIPRNVGI